jgi:glycosyltransferase Alg8
LLSGRISTTPTRSARVRSRDVKRIGQTDEKYIAGISVSGDPHVGRDDERGRTMSLVWDAAPSDSHEGRIQRRYAPQVASRRDRVIIGCFLLYSIALLIVLIPPDVFSPSSKAFFVTIALIGLWRYSWWFLQAVRALIYTRVRFPAYRRAADRLQNSRVEKIFALVTSYKMNPDVTRAVYGALLREIADYNAPALIVASVTGRDDLLLLKRLVGQMHLSDRVELLVMFQDGTGKRPAMAEALRAISRRMPTHNSVCILMDGDCRINAGTLRKVLPFFRLMPDVGAVTLDNRGITTGSSWAREWYDLRFAQRHLVMSSLSLSRRLLVLTGRFSVFRAQLATHPSFIDQLERDEIDHWRFGRFRFLSGDDKSTWFWLLRNGWRMLYVPDARADSFEQLPRPSLLAGSVPLMRRWFGNMLRSNGRALRLGPGRLGYFMWWALLDQRISMWTSLVGPVAAIMLSLTYRPSFMLVYCLWVLSTRTVLSIGLAMVARRFSPFWPFLFYFNQVVGALVKIHVSFRLNQQSWTRQRISTGSTGNRIADAMQRLGNVTMHAMAAISFVVAMAFYTEVLSLPHLNVIQAIAAQPSIEEQAAALESAMRGFNATLPPELPMPQFSPELMLPIPEPKPW